MPVLWGVLYRTVNKPSIPAGLMRLSCQLSCWPSQIFRGCLRLSCWGVLLKNGLGYGFGCSARTAPVSAPPVGGGRTAGLHGQTGQFCRKRKEYPMATRLYARSRWRRASRLGRSVTDRAQRSGAAGRFERAA